MNESGARMKTAQLGPLEQRKVSAQDFYGPPCRCEEPLQQTQQSGFAGAARADDDNLFARFDGKARNLEGG